MNIFNFHVFNNQDANNNVFGDDDNNLYLHNISSTHGRINNNSNNSVIIPNRSSNINYSKYSFFGRPIEIENS